jgi:hypothetical protein
MENTIIDKHMTTFLIACLITGIDVESDPTELMTELVAYMNSTERIFWTEGDEDGVIVHDKNDQPLLYVIYNGKRMTFRTFDYDEFIAIESKTNIAYALLNVIGYLRSQELPFCPSVLGSEAHVIKNEQEQSDDTSSTLDEDWAL